MRSDDEIETEMLKEGLALLEKQVDEGQIQFQRARNDRRDFLTLFDILELIQKCRGTRNSPSERIIRIEDLKDLQVKMQEALDQKCQFEEVLEMMEKVAIPRKQKINQTLRADPDAQAAIAAQRPSEETSREVTLQARIKAANRKHYHAQSSAQGEPPKSPIQSKKDSKPGLVKSVKKPFQEKPRESAVQPKLGSDTQAMKAVKGSPGEVSGKSAVQSKTSLKTPVEAQKAEGDKVSEFGFVFTSIRGGMYDIKPTLKEKLLELQTEYKSSETDKIEGAIKKIFEILKVKSGKIETIKAPELKNLLNIMKLPSFQNTIERHPELQDVIRQEAQKLPKKVRQFILAELPPIKRDISPDQSPRASK